MGTPNIAFLKNGIGCGPQYGGYSERNEKDLENFKRLSELPLEQGDSEIQRGLNPDNCMKRTTGSEVEEGLQSVDTYSGVNASTETVKTTTSNPSIFDKTASRQIWGGSQAAINVLRTVSTVLNEVDGIDSDVRFALNLAKVALGLFLSTYDLANGVHVTEKFERNQDFYRKQLEDSIEKASRALDRIKPRNNAASASASALGGTLILSGALNSTTTEATLLDEINGYVESREALEKLAKYSPSDKGQDLINKLGNAKDVMSLVSSLSNIFRSLQGWVPVLATGAGAAVAGTVAAGLTLGIGVVFSSYEIVQGFTAIESATKERSKFSEIKARLEISENFANLSEGFKAGLSNFFSRKIENANISLASAVSRVIRGVVGIVVAVVGIAALVASVGNAGFVAAIAGGISSALYFVGIVLRINRDIGQAEANKAEKAAAENLKSNFGNAVIFRNLTSLDNPNDNDADPVPGSIGLDDAYQNKYFMAWCLAKQFNKECIDSVADASAGDGGQIEVLLTSLGLTDDDINVMKLLPKGEPGNAAVIEKLIGLRIGIY